jgi:subtilisin family serine protease
VSSVVVALCAATALVFAQSSATPSEKFVLHSEGLSDRWIVKLTKTSAGPLGAKSRAEAVAKELAAEYGGTVSLVYTHVLNGFAVEMPEANAKSLSAHEAVEYVEQEVVGHTQGTQYNPGWALDRVDQRYLALDNAYSYPIAGVGIVVHMIDSGIRASHDEFGGRAVQEVNWVPDGNGGNDCSGHGTTVASTIAGSSLGAAKNATIHSLRVCDCSNNCYPSRIIAALNYVVQAADKPAVANLSVTSPPRQLNRCSGARCGLLQRHGRDSCRQFPRRRRRW